MKIGAVITAAGLSSRMGDFKPLLPYKNTTMLRHVIGLLREAGAEPVVVVAGYRAEEIKKHVADMGVQVAENREYASTQMFDSIKLGLSALMGRCERAAFMPVDVPDISPELVHRVFEAEGKFVRPVYHGRPGHPVVLDGELLPRICGYEGDRGLRGAMEAIGAEITEVEAEDDGIYNDIDTVEDYRNLLQKTEGTSGKEGRTLYLVRHGAVEFPGGERRCIGRTDLPLSETGRRQADRLRAWFQDKNIRYVYSSSLSRAVETARRLAPEGAELRINDCFMEMDMGDWENRPLKSLHKKLEDEAPKGETRAEALKRFSEGIGQLLGETTGNVAVVSHAGVLCAYLSKRLNLPLETSRGIRQPYCGISTLAVREGSSPKVVEYGVRAEKAPDDEEIQRLFEKCGTPEQVRRHCRTVAEEAVRMAELLNGQGRKLDVELVRAAALLHDVLRQQKKHAMKGYELLLREGYPETAEIIRQHDWLDKAFLNEAALVYDADKKFIEETPVSLEERFRKSAEKTAGNKDAELAHERRYRQAQEVRRILEKALSGGK